MPLLCYFLRCVLANLVISDDVFDSDLVSLQQAAFEVVCDRLIPFSEKLFESFHTGETTPDLRKIANRLITLFLRLFSARGFEEQADTLIQTICLLFPSKDLFCSNVYLSFERNWIHPFWMMIFSNFWYTFARNLPTWDFGLDSILKNCESTPWVIFFSVQLLRILGWNLILLEQYLRSAGERKLAKKSTKGMPRKRESLWWKSPPP